MKTSLIFSDMKVTLTITPESDWEKKMLGAAADGGNSLECEVRYNYKSPFSYGNCDLLQLVLTKPALTPVEPSEYTNG